MFTTITIVTITIIKYIIHQFTLLLLPSASAASFLSGHVYCWQL